MPKLKIAALAMILVGTFLVVKYGFLMTSSERYYQGPNAAPIGAVLLVAGGLLFRGFKG